MFVSKNNVKNPKTLFIREWIRFVTANSAVTRLECSAIYSHNTNMISGKIFPSSSTQIHTDEREAMHSNSEQSATSLWFSSTESKTSL
jgi:hypothetical protein